MEVTLASITQATKTQYSRPIKLWWLYCKQNQIDCFCPSPSAVLEFLSISVASSRSYSSLNTVRSAVSLISVNEVGSHPLVRRFFKGIAALKPQRPRYDFIWDTAPVVTRLASLYPHDNLSLELLSRKLATLLALTTAQRLQTLAAIQTSNISFADSLVIKIPARIKTSGVGKYQPLLVFKPFLDKPELCLFSIVKSYLDRTQSLRRGEVDSLFISTRPPHKPVTSQSLGRWIKTELAAAGIDTSIFSAYSTRHASTSRAASKGISLQEIRRTAGWSSSSEVFARFYKRPIISEPAFQASILNPT
ncbi:uncharacterized protein LOC120357547 [Solenopsis invicta]|uniref:uncharacterized protein LOC120357547 n=1 Tax=Solenopsis invicta TaxID=13686 RepID=UPI00193D71EE|nr:uncharacterized protein LOC120357547 [Solenopsis invicta]